MTHSTTIGITVCDDVPAAEILGPLDVFHRAQQLGFPCELVLINVDGTQEICTAEGLRIKTAHTLATAPALDALLVPGVADPDALLANLELQALIKRQAAEGGWLASVCAGAFVLGGAGVLDGQPATTWHGGEADLQERFPAVRVQHDTPVVIGDRRITANGGLVSYGAALALLAALGEAPLARRINTSLGLERIGAWDQRTA